MNKLKKILNSLILRWLFLAIVFAGLLWVIVKNWASLTEALTALPWQIAVSSFVLAVAYVFFTSALTSGGVLAVVLVSRITMTFADLLFAALGAY